MIPRNYKFINNDEQDETDTFGGRNLPSGNKAQAIHDAIRLIELLNKPQRDEAHIWGHSDYVLRELAGISESECNVIPNLGFQTPAEVTDIVKLFVENWLQNVRLQINLGRGVQFWVSAIEAQRHNRQTDP